MTPAPASIDVSRSDCANAGVTPVAVIRMSANESLRTILMKTISSAAVAFQTAGQRNFPAFQRGLCLRAALAVLSGERRAVAFRRLAAIPPLSYANSRGVAAQRIDRAPRPGSPPRLDTNNLFQIRLR